MGKKIKLEKSQQASECCQIYKKKTYAFGIQNFKFISQGFLKMALSLIICLVFSLLSIKNP